MDLGKLEEKAQSAGRMARAELNHPLMPAGAKRALLAMAETLEAVAHEVEILKVRQGGGNGKG